MRGATVGVGVIIVVDGLRTRWRKGVRQVVVDVYICTRSGSPLPLLKVATRVGFDNRRTGPSEFQELDLFLQIRESNLFDAALLT